MRSQAVTFEVTKQPEDQMLEDGSFSSSGK